MKKKLIEVALPLEAINVASAREKSIRHGHPSTLHLWWARRPLAAARAVIFAQMVDDPSAHPDVFPTEKDQEKERKRLFKIIEELVQWENTTNEEVLQRARDEIWNSWRRTCAENADHPRAAELFDRKKLPAFHDPFAGGGTLPLEAQRLGLEAYASDLNPVAVLINKAMIEIPPKFAGRPPMNPEWQRKPQREKELRTWKGAQGLAEDVRYYGQWMRDEAEKRIGHLYPKVEVTAAMAKKRPDLKPHVGQKLTVIAWLWARTVKSPNPAFANVDVPLASTFVLGSKPGKEAHIEPVVGPGGYGFTVKAGRPNDEAAADGTKLSRGANFRCLMSGTPITAEYIKAEGRAGRMGVRLMATVAEGDRGRVYLSPSAEMEAVAQAAKPAWKPETPLPDDPRNFWTVQYGLVSYGDIFTPRQLVTLTALSDLVEEGRERVERDAATAGLSVDGKPLANGGAGLRAYGEAIAVYLSIAVARYANASTTVCSWNPGTKKEDIRFTFSRQALPMTWDFAEGNPFSASSGNFSDNIDTWLYKALLSLPATGEGTASPADAAAQPTSVGRVVSTDPPYYDNISYADLSDFFYVWERRSLRTIYPDLFATLAVPKAEELVATPYRHGTKGDAETFFLNGMTRAMQGVAGQSHPGFPATIYYAFKQAESQSELGTASTGWETFLDAVIRAGLSVSGTWPVRTEREGRTIGIGSNALASSIVLVCRPRPTDAPTGARRDFVNALKAELPTALTHLQRSNTAPVDLAQAAIGPGMAVYTRYSQVLDATGSPVTVRDALFLINQVLDEVLTEQEGDFDGDSRWALAWFDQFGFRSGGFGVADVLARAKNTSVDGLKAAGIVTAGGGDVRLLTPKELPPDWDPAADTRLTAWEMVHHLTRALEADGEGAAAKLVTKLGGKAEVARELAYRLYAICERKKRAGEARSYNGLVQSWPEISQLARQGSTEPPAQAQMFKEQ